MIDKTALARIIANSFRDHGHVVGYYKSDGSIKDTISDERLESLLIDDECNLLAVADDILAAMAEKKPFGELMIPSIPDNDLSTGGPPFRIVPE